MFRDNLIQLRKMHKLTQEDIAEKVGVSRQAVAKWESGDSIPDIDRCRMIADLFNVTLDDLVNYNPENTEGLLPPPKGRYLFGIVTIGEKGQIVIPAKARKIFSLQPGEKLVVLGDESQGLALMKADGFLSLADRIRSDFKND